MKAKRTGAKKGPRLGTKMRGTLQDAYDLRATQKSDLVNTYSLKRQQDTVVSGGLRFLNFLLIESDPDITSVRYVTARVDESPTDIKLDAEILDRRGVLKLRFVSSDALPMSAKQRIYRDACLEQYRTTQIAAVGQFRSVEFERFTEQEIIPGNEVRLRNWCRLLPWYAQARFHSLSHSKRVFAGLLESKGGCTAKELVSWNDDQEEGALLMAAALEAVANGRCQSTLNQREFGGNTRFFMRGHE